MTTPEPPPPDNDTDADGGPTDLNDDELKDIVSAISPDLSALLDEDALDNLLIDTSRIADDDANNKRRHKAKSGEGGDDDDE